MNISPEYPVYRFSLFRCFWIRPGSRATGEALPSPLPINSSTWLDAYGDVMHIPSIHYCSSWQERTRKPNRSRSSRHSIQVREPRLGERNYREDRRDSQIILLGYPNLFLSSFSFFILLSLFLDAHLRDESTGKRFRSRQCDPCSHRLYFYTASSEVFFFNCRWFMFYCSFADVPDIDHSTCLVVYLSPRFFPREKTRNRAHIRHIVIT